MHPIRFWSVCRSALLSLGLVAFLAGAAGAALVYEPFDYTIGQSLTLPSGSSPVSLPDTPYDWDAGAGFQTASEWGLGRDGTAGTATATIVPALRFPGLRTSGGSMQFNHSGDGFGAIVRPVGVNVATGELWASYLYRAVNTTINGVADVRFRNAAAGQFGSGSSRKFRNLGDAASGTLFGGVGGADAATASDGPALNDARTYLLVAKFANVGQTGTAKWWALSQQNFDRIRFDGVLTEAELDALNVDKVTQGTQASQVVASGDWLQVTTYQGSAIYDELRFGASLVEVMPPTAQWRSLYEEKFPDSTGNNLTMNAAGWSVAVGPTAVDYTNTMPGMGTRAGVSYFNGSPDGIPGFGFAVPDAAPSAAPQFLTFTDEFTPIDLADFSELRFLWRQHASGEGAEYRLALEIGGNWYATDAPFVNTGASQTGAGGEFASEGVLRTINFSPLGSLWRDLNFTPGTLLSLAGSARTLDLPEGLMTRAGLFLSAPNGTSMRFDTFQIEGVPLPEPAALAMLALGGLALAAMRAWRRPG
jgi:hypothetical protein